MGDTKIILKAYNDFIDIWILIGDDINEQRINFMMNRVVSVMERIIPDNSLGYKHKS